MKPPRFRTSRSFDLIFILLISLGVWQAVVHKIEVGDWIFFLHYKPSAQVEQLADQAGFTPEGRRLFYRGNPQLNVSKAERDAACGGGDVGCITPKGQIYIYSPNNDMNDELVTAAHETLHLAYRRYDSSTKNKIDTLIGEALTQKSATVQLQRELYGYEGDERLDEAHSYLGSEYPNLPAGLESHYRQYFNDRQIEVRAYAAD